MKTWHYFNRTNYLLLLLALLCIALGLAMMSLDPNPYGYGLAGLTIGPLILALGLIVPFIAIFKTSVPVTKLSSQDGWIIAGGWLVFIIALATYGYTAERTSSFWDCGEFIAAAYKLQIPHPPGAPLFLLIGRIFSMFAPSTEWIAYAVNLVSAFSSAATCAILYHTIILILKKIFIKQIPDRSGIIIIIFAGLTGSLSFAFTDSFWFNATEAEVYAMSCLFTALSFWGILKWESQAERPDSAKWLFFIAYTTGLSTGVHLLNLLSLPALAFVYYFKIYSVTWKGTWITFLTGIGLILLLTEGIIIGLPSLAGMTEVLLVNTFGLPFYSGIFLFCLLLVGGFYWIIYFANQTKRSWLHTASLCVLFVLTGYMSYLMVLVRSSYNTPLDENDPGNIMSLILYLKRDQYGSRPLLKGPNFTAGYPTEIIKGAPRYRKDEDTQKYLINDYDYTYKYNQKHTTFFPRMYSTEQRHVEAYRSWNHLKIGQKPTMKDNLWFFLSYQLGHQYWRYFLWNFAGRSSDQQGAEWLHPAQWFSKKLPELLKQNRARNNYYLLPLIMGLAGFFFHFKKNRKDALVVLLVFFFSGVAIIIYLNQPPTEPRERDYTFVGSFYAFSIWIGIGVFALFYFITKLWGNSIFPKILATLLGLIIPCVLLQQNWDDHNRTGRYFAEDSAKNVLNACDPQSILFTVADNDTFPLWYLQEVKNFKTDVRVCILGYLNMDWYIEGMKLQCNKSMPLPISLHYEDYRKGQNEHIYPFANPRLKNGINLEVYLQLLRKKDPAVYRAHDNSQEFTVLPSTKVFLKTNKDEVRKLMSSEINSFLVDKIEFNIPDGLTKSALIVLDIIQANRWKRPIYFNYSAIQDLPFLKPYLQKEGFVYRLMPAKVMDQEGWLNDKKMYCNMMEKATWRGLSATDVYNDPAALPFIAQSRNDFYILAEAFFRKGDRAKAKGILLHSLKIFPDHAIPYDYTLVKYIGLFLKLGEDNLANELATVLFKRSIEFLEFYQHEKNKPEQEIHLYTLYELTSIFAAAGEERKSMEYRNQFEKYYKGELQETY